MRDAAAPPLRVLDDVHARLNCTPVRAVITPVDRADVARLVRQAGREHRALIPMGARHAMGGQQFLRDGLVLDTHALNRVRAFDPVRGTITVEAGMRWPELLACLAAEPGNTAGWTLRQKQTGADDFSLGGSLAANIHGRGLAYAPIVDDVESIEVVGADGRIVVASRDEHHELFALAVGGYGLFGVITAVTLRLMRRTTLVRRVELTRASQLQQRFAARIAEGCSYGDFQFSVDPSSADFLDLGILSCYAPVPDRTPDGDARHLGPDDFRRLLLLAHCDKARGFAEYADFYLASDGQVYTSDAQQSGVYLDGYHDYVDTCLGHLGSEMITELYVPRECLAAFLAHSAEVLRRERADLIYGTVRLIERDRVTCLAWAREPWACIVLNLHLRHDAAGIAHGRRAFRALIDAALSFGGSYYLTYHRWARADQIDAAHPRLREFLRCKRELDPHATFRSDWYAALCVTLGEAR